MPGSVGVVLQSGMMAPTRPGAAARARHRHHLRRHHRQRGRPRSRRLHPLLRRGRGDAGHRLLRRADQDAGAIHRGLPAGGRAPEADRHAQDRPLRGRARRGAGAHRLAGRPDDVDRCRAAQARRQPRLQRRRAATSSWRSSTRRGCRAARAWRRSSSRAAPPGCSPTWRRDCGVDLPQLPEATARPLRESCRSTATSATRSTSPARRCSRPRSCSASLDLLAEAPDIDVVVYGRGFPAALDRQAAGRPDPRGRHRTAIPRRSSWRMSLVGGHFFNRRQYPDVPLVEPMDRLGGMPFLQGSEYGLQGHRGADSLRRVHSRVAAHRHWRAPLAR